jgi:hypothetical protein
MAIKIAAPQPDLPNIRKHLRPRTAWRVFGWGSAATIALAAVAFTGQTEAGSKRLQLALAMVSEPVRVVAQIPPTSTEAETQRLATQLRDLAADRERLTARIAILERNLADMTGSIKQQSEQLAAARATNTPPPTPSAPATTPAVVAAAPPPAPALPALTPLAVPKVSETAAASTATTKPAQAAERAPDQVPLPPVRVAAAPASEPAAEPPPAKLEYGIDLGAATSLEALRFHWAAVKANYGPLLVGLHPVATQHTKTPTGISYRLVAGPLPDIAAATQLCARFPVTRTGCRAAKFTGAQLAEH